MLTFAMVTSLRSTLTSVDLNVASMPAHSNCSARSGMSQFDDPDALSSSSVKSTSMYDSKKSEQGKSTVAKKSTEILQNDSIVEQFNGRSWSHDVQVNARVLNGNFLTTYSYNTNRLRTPGKNAVQKAKILKAIQHKFNYDLIPLTNTVAETLHFQRKSDFGAYTMAISQPFKVQHTFDGNLISIQDAQKRQQIAKVNDVCAKISMGPRTSMYGRPRLVSTISAHTPIKFVSVRRPSLVDVLEDYVAHRATVQWMTQRHTTLPVTSSIGLNLDCIN